MMFVRLYRIIPFLLILAAVAGVVYLVVAARRSPTRAKEVLIKVFVALTTALSAFFAVVSLYAWLEHNDSVFDLAFSFCLASLVCLGITLLCRARFLKNNPHYRKKPKKAERLK